MNDLYPVRLKPGLVPLIWGGRILQDMFNKDSENAAIGESWEVSAQKKSLSVVLDGDYKGWSFDDYIAETLNCPPSKFPILIKLIGPTQKLSVQVHPDDEYAITHGDSCGKSEAWVILHAKKGAQLVCGIDCTREEFKKIFKENKIESKLRYLPIKKGDVILIKPGVVHAITAGVVCYEIQQNSDTTYRMYDWGRVDKKTGAARELHIEKAIDVIDFNAQTQKILGIEYKENGFRRIKYISNDKFSLEKIIIEDHFEDKWRKGFSAYTVIDGAGKVNCGGEKRSFEVKKGESFFSPIDNNHWSFSGQAVLLKGGCPWYKNHN